MITRRNFVKAMVLIGLSGYAGNVFALAKQDRVLNLYNIHTDERLAVKYFSNGAYDRDAINQINHLLRCHYSNEVKPIDIQAVDLLCDIKDRIGKDEEIHIISGYRSPAYNEYLRSIGRGVVHNSLHLQGRAIDFCIPNISNGKLSSLAKSFHTGGVGKYPAFIHIDTGRVRYW
jgi:uncharacterized protein YcbK (DUF882 family)